MLFNQKKFKPRFLHKLSSAPLIKSEYRNNCILCNSKFFKNYAGGYDYEINTTSNYWNFKKCLSCGHIQLNPIPCKSELSRIYPKSYYSYNLSKKVSSFILFGKDFLDNLKIRGILKNISSKVDNYLDIGCGDGRYLKAVKTICNLPKEKICGVEIDKITSDKILSMGFKCFNSSIEELNDLKDESYSLITMFHVIEHTSNPKDIIKKLSRVLKNGGHLIIETPNLNSIDSKFFEKSYWGAYHFPRHWHLFTPKSLIRLTKSLNLTPIRLSFQTGHSFWLYSIHHLLKYQLGLSKLARLFDPLESKFFLIFFTIFDFLRAKLGFNTSSMMLIVKK